MSEPARKPYKSYFDERAAKMMSEQVKAVHPSFDRATFRRLAIAGLSTLEFHDRVRQFADALAQTLPTSVPRALRVLRESLPEPLPNCDSPTDGWLQWPIGHYIGQYGQDYVDESFVTMIALTTRFTAEFAVRPFVEQDPEGVCARMLELSSHDNPHVRRWCSEGVRPRLPWGKKISALVNNPAPIIPILRALENDDERYVQRSVANTLGDVAKDNRETALKWARAMVRRGGPKRTWIVTHGLRLPLKEGDPRALKLLGYVPLKRVQAKLELTPTRVKIGESIELGARLESEVRNEQRVLVDVVMHYVRARGAAPKPFKWSKGSLSKASPLQLKKSIPLRETSTRKLYPGAHRVTLQVNGVELAEASFDLVK